MKKLVVLISLLLCFPAIDVLAHPGHGETGGYTIIHYFTEPLHYIVPAILLMGVVLYIRFSRRNKQKSN